MDEPANYLDIQTLTVLKDYLDTFPGIVIAVSHDRYFLNRVVNRIFAFEGQGKITQYEGGFTDYQRAAEKRDEEITGKSECAKPGETAPNHPVNRNNRKAALNVPKKKKFTFKEQRERETLEDEIVGLEAAIGELDQEMAESAANYTRLSELTVEKGVKEKELEEKMERWLVLNDLAEQIRKQ